MNAQYEQYVTRFKLTKEDYKNLKALDAKKSAILQDIIAETYSTNGEIAVDKYLENTFELDVLMGIHVNPGDIKTAIYDDPYRIKIFVPDYPPRLKEHNKTKFSSRLGYSTSFRWHNYMRCALKELREKGAHNFKEKVVVIMKYHYAGGVYDVDNYALKFVNDALKYSKFIDDDSYLHTDIYSTGVPKMDFAGTEITVLTSENFKKYIAAII